MEAMKFNRRFKFYKLLSLGIIVVITPMTGMFSQTVTECGYPIDNFWDFEDILSGTCPNIGCNGDGDFPELFPQCRCGTSPGVACNYHTSHGTPHWHLDQENRFGAMISRTIIDEATPLGGEGIYFCVPEAKEDYCVHLNFDLIVKRNFHYETAILNIKLVNPDEMETELGTHPGGCVLDAPDLNPLFVQTVQQTFDVEHYSAYNNTNAFYYNNIDLYYAPDYNVISETTGSYYLWFYFENSDTRGEIIGIDNIQLNVTADLVCSDHPSLFEPYAPIQGNYYGAYGISIWSMNDPLPISKTATFTASNYISVDPKSVFTDISEDEYVLFQIEPVSCVGCSVNAPAPYVENTKDPIRIGDKFSIFNASIDNDETPTGLGDSKESSYASDVKVFSLLGQLLFSGRIENGETFDLNILHFLPSGVYFVITQNLTDKSELMVRRLMK